MASKGVMIAGLAALAGLALVMAGAGEAKADEGRKYEPPPPVPKGPAPAPPPEGTEEERELLSQLETLRGDLLRTTDVENVVHMRAELYRLRSEIGLDEPDVEVEAYVVGVANAASTTAIASNSEGEVFPLWEFLGASQIFHNDFSAARNRLEEWLQDSEAAANKLERDEAQRLLTLGMNAAYAGDLVTADNVAYQLANLGYPSYAEEIRTAAESYIEDNS
jgi:hypothetical protein